MLFSSKKSLPSVRLYDGECLLYDGLLHQIPLKESIILQKSIEFFRDPEPCHIHRNAVRVRLTAEIQEELKSLSGNEPGTLLPAYADYPRISSFVLY